MICIGTILSIIGLVIIFTPSSSTKNSTSSISVLFIGNSLTGANNLPETISKIANSLGDNMIYDSVAVAGYTLEQHSQDQNTINIIKSKKWDTVVIQEQSEIPALSQSFVDINVVPYAIKLATIIRKSNPAAKIIYFETWGYRNGDPYNCDENPTVCSYELMQESLSKSYLRMAQETSGTVAPVGQAWGKVRKNYPIIELYRDDSHPSETGTYLAACVMYKTIFKKAVTGASSLSIPKSNAVVLQQITQLTE